MCGTAFYLLKPFFQNNTAFVTTTRPGTPSSVVENEPFHWDYNPTAAFWLGWSLPCGLGVRSRYFFFDQGSITTNVSNTTTAPPQTTINPPLANFLFLSTGGTAFGSPGTVLNSGFGTDQLSFASHLKINAVDVEVTYAFTWEQWSLLGSGGGRFMTIDQGYHATLFNSGGGRPVSEAQFFDATRKFTGGGLVVGLQANRYIAKTGLSLFGSLRGSWLLGESNTRVGFSQTVDDPTGLILPGGPGTLHISPTANQSADHVLSVLEVELGLQYDVDLGPTKVFARAAAVDQTYFEVGNASAATGSLSLFGFQLSAGLNY
jgi:hypothetical protein